MIESPLKIAFLSPHRSYMGDTRPISTLARELSGFGHKVDLPQSWKEWQHLDYSGSDSGVQVVSLRTGPRLKGSNAVISNDPREGARRLATPQGGVFFRLIGGLN